MFEMIIFMIATIFVISFLLTFILLGLITYTFIHDKIVDIYCEIKNWFKERKE